MLLERVVYTVVGGLLVGALVSGQSACSVGRSGVVLGVVVVGSGTVVVVSANVRLARRQRSLVVHRRLPQYTCLQSTQGNGRNVYYMRSIQGGYIAYMALKWPIMC